jgi:5-methylcytosine-specific restriction protein A
METIVENEAKNNTLSADPIDLARAFVKSTVQLPALNSALPQKIKNKIKHSDQWLDRFTRVGDLLYYLQRFKTEKNDPIYQEMKKHGLETFEDIAGRFERKFRPWANDCLKISDFVIGHQYPVYDILILARNYDTRAGGMFVLQANDEPVAVIIKATLSEGRYPNKWIQEGEILKYYLKSISGNFGVHFKPNRAIKENPDLPVVAFTRDSESAPFIFRGIFKYFDILEENEGRKAFMLRRASEVSNVTVMSFARAQEKLEKGVQKAKERSRSERLKRLAVAPKRPISYFVRTTAFLRNPDVIAEVLYRAKGICESCVKPAPFLRSSNEEPYLEVHHRLPLSQGGEDTVENAIALCPNCHRERHFGTLYVTKATFPNHDVKVSSHHMPPSLDAESTKIVQNDSINIIKVVENEFPTRVLKSKVVM